MIDVLAAERTFWEKVTLLHAENHAPEPLSLKPRMSRHWSDVAGMSPSEMFVTERLDFRLLEEVVKFKKIYFGSSWANYDSACPGGMKLVPNDALCRVLKDDYRAMRE